jgi:outer membrane protein assembly factor BamB
LLLEKQLTLDPVPGVEAATLADQVRAGSLDPVDRALEGALAGLDARQRRARIWQGVGGAVQVAGSLVAASGWLAGAVVGGLRLGLWGALGGALAGALAGVAVGMPLGILGDKIYHAVQPPGEKERTAAERLQEARRRLGQGPARRPEQIQAADRAAARAAARPSPAPAADGDPVSALFGSQELRLLATFPLPPEAVVAPAATPEGYLLVAPGARVAALDSTTGGQVWSHELPAPAVHLTVQGERALVSYRGGLQLLEAGSGQPLGVWTRAGGDYRVALPVLDARGRVLAPDWPGGLACLEGGRPAPLWTFAGGRRDHTAAGPDGMVYQSHWEEPLVALDGDSGALRWKGPVGPPITGKLVVAPDGTLLGVDEENRLTALDPDFGMRQWCHPDSQRPVISADGRSVFALDARGERLRCLDLATGARRWEARLEGECRLGPVVAGDGAVLLADHQGCIYRFDPQQGVALHTARLEEGLQALVPLPDGDLVAVGHKQAYRLTLRPAPEEDPGTIEQEEEYVVIGGVRVPITQRGAPPAA